MCGFGGAINHYRSVTSTEVGKIAAAVNFRGPDSCGISILDNELNNCESGNNALFFNRLAIIDLDNRSNQPFEDDTHILTFNGEIYNYNELKAELEKEGFRFRTSSDTEVLFYALKCWNAKALEKLNGMFAFSWINRKDRTIMICRDRLGIKPLYYCSSGGGFYFSSELHSIVRFLPSKPAVSQQAMENYLWMQFVPTPDTILENIYKLPPGTYIKFSIGDIPKAIYPTTYWDAYSFAVEKRADPGILPLEAILKDSVGRQLHADVPIGLFLSSGVDSSLLAAIVNKYFSGNQEVNFFTVAFNEKTETDESAEALAFIKEFKNPNLKHHLLNIDPSMLIDRLFNLYDFYDEPFGDYASLLNWAISSKAREHVTVALSGDGADELFWGYTRYNRWQQSSKLSSIPLVSPMARSAGKLFPVSTIQAKIQRKLATDPVERHFNEFLLPGFYGHFKSSITGSPIWALQNVDTIRDRPDLPAILDIKTYLSDAMLYKVDRSSMASSLEVRVPYLDNEVLEYALHLNMRYKSNRRFKNKAVLKELLVSLAPHYKVFQPKRGFSFSLDKWLKQHWKQEVLQTVTKDSLLALNLDPDYFMNQLTGFYNGKSGNHVEIWYLLNLILWKKNYDALKSVNDK